MLFEDTVLSIRRGAGTGLFLVEYYDIGRNVFSEVFQTVFLTEYGKIVYIGRIEDEFRLVVRDIFDKSEFYKEFELDFAPLATPFELFRHGEFLDENTLKISYMSESRTDTWYEEKEVILELG